MSGLTGINDVGVVAIGRDEGERLRVCLASVVGRAGSIVYVDSGSSDKSVEFAREMGVEVVELDLACPFTAARARNAGFDRLMELTPDLRYVQFVDGDCEIVEAWLDRAREELETHLDVAVVCGRRRERFPAISVYNRLADLEWDTPIGETKACGGDAMMRVTAFQGVGGFDPTLIAGEEPELCVRIRSQGWTVRRIDAEMTLHDMEMTRFGQWWRRSVRAGYAYTEGAARHGRSPERHWTRETRSIVTWGLVVPLATLALIWPTQGIALAASLAYPLQGLRIAWRARQKGWSLQNAGFYATACVVAKFPQALGTLRYWTLRSKGERSDLIEYKSPY